MRSGVRACRCFAGGARWALHVLKTLEMNARRPALAAFVTRGARPGLSPVPRARAPPRATCDEPSVDGSGLLFNAIFCDCPYGFDIRAVQRSLLRPRRDAEIYM